MKTLMFAALAVAMGLASGARADEAVAARVNGTAITEKEVSELAERLAAAAEEEGEGEVGRDDALQTLIELELLVQAAKAENLAPSAKELDSELERLKAQFPSGEEFNKIMAENKLTETQVRADLERRLAMQKLLDKHVTVKLAPGAVEKFYKENPDKFEHPAEVRLSHILFRVPPGGDAEAVRKKAEETLVRLRKGEDFDAVAKSVSEDPGSIQNNGDLGFLARDSMPSAMADVAFKMKPGEVSEVVKTDFGLHILKLTEARPAGLTPLADVRPQLDRYLEEQEHLRQSQAFMESLRKKATIELVKQDAKPKDPVPGGDQSKAPAQPGGGSEAKK